MRLLRLDLVRYGHVSGEVLEFPPDRGLHVVLGANEAGKSTALEALADGLFGFGKDSRKLRHPDDPLVGFALLAADGSEGRFQRRRNGRDKLLDGGGAAVPEAALVRFLGGTSRKRFREMFGLDGERLRQGGRAILSEHGEAGAAVLQAQTGLAGLREVVARLDDEAKTLFGDGRGARRISRAAATVKEGRRLMAERSLTGAEHARATDAEATLSGQLTLLDKEAEGLHAEQSRLERTRRTAPVRDAMAEASSALLALGTVPDLPADAAQRRMTALAARDQASRDLARDQARAATVGEQLAALRPDPPVLAEAEAITALAADLSRIAQARRDRVMVAAQAADVLAELARTAALLEVAERGAALRARLPDPATRRRAERLLKQQAERAGRLAAAEAQRRAVLAVEMAEQARTAAPENADALRHALEAANRAGDIDTALAEAATRCHAAASEAAVALAGLPLWAGDMALLERSPVPLEAEALRLGRAMETAQATRDAAAAALAAQDRASAAGAVAMAGLRRSGPLPTADAIAALRARRDGTWQRLRRHLLDGSAAPPGMPDELDRLLREADELADRRGAEAVRVAEWENLLDEQARLFAARPALVAAEAEAERHLEAARADWRPRLGASQRGGAGPRFDARMGAGARCRAVGRPDGTCGGAGP